jgi:hypothetical protein
MFLDDPRWTSAASARATKLLELDSVEDLALAFDGGEGFLAATSFALFGGDFSVEENRNIVS